MTKFEEKVYESGKTLKELAREYSEKNDKTVENAQVSGGRYFRNGVRTLTKGALNWADVLGCSFKDLKE